MEAKELRIGNLIEFDCEIRTVDTRLIAYMSNCERLKQNHPFQPIPLTEEWLLRFGFKKRNDGDFDLFKFSEVDIVISKDFDLWKCDGICFSVNALQYVHQLQNLYFALTGEELVLK